MKTTARNIAWEILFYFLAITTILGVLGFYVLGISGMKDKVYSIFEKHTVEETIEFEGEYVGKDFTVGIMTDETNYGAWVTTEVTRTESRYYGIYIELTEEELEWTDEQLQGYMWSKLDLDQGACLIVELDEGTREYCSLKDMPIEDDCIDEYNCFIKFEVLDEDITIEAWDESDWKGLENNIEE